MLAHYLVARPQRVHTTIRKVLSTDGEETSYDLVGHSMIAEQITVLQLGVGSQGEERAVKVRRPGDDHWCRWPMMVWAARQRCGSQEEMKENDRIGANSD